MSATDKKLLDWLCEQSVEVRSPYPLGGSKHLFYASPPMDDDDGPSDLRAQIAAAIAKEKK